ncbi:MAG TPA: hypothetical protein VN736_06175 [Candidatus Limnocylindrales bacterium]|nr:hypothetical protein [Candidatus Limnocylindrales bacterium]
MIERLHALAKNHDHAQAMIAKWLNTQTAAPKVANLVDLAGEVRAEHQTLPDGCNVCRGELWIVVETGAKRCSCARGLALKAKDRAREDERRAKNAA